VEVPELFEVGSVTRLVQIENDHHEAWPTMIPADAAGGLDVLSRRLGLALHDHQPEAQDIQADRDHVGGESDVH
jgi:hypothetical protein